MENSQVLYFSHARTALKFGLGSLGLSGNDTILIPSFICDVVLHPIKQLGINYLYYSVTQNLSPDWPTVHSLLNPSVKAILMVHYFGIPQDIEIFSAFCKQHNIFLIEDNAHGQGGRYAGKELGTYGDIGISSPRKQLHINSGGILYLKKPTTREFIKLSPIKSYTLLKKIKWIIKDNALFKLVWRQLSKRVRYEDLQNFPEETVADFAIDNESLKIIKHTDWDIVQKTRISAYHKWEIFCTQHGLKPLFSKYSEESCPLCFPALVDRPENAGYWFDWGWKTGVKVYSWPTLPGEIISKYPDAYRFWKRIICFSIDSDSNYFIQRKIDNTGS